MAIPTLDWPQVKNAHLQNCIYRAIESRYAIVRSATNGISAIISPRGEIISKIDHLVDGPGVIVSEVPVYEKLTVFSLAGHWPVPLSIFFLVSYIVYHYMVSKRQKFSLAWK